MSEDKRLAEGGAKDRRSSLKNDEEDPALRHESRQSVLNQGKAKPEDYPHRDDKLPI
ncbi:MAG TPA: hypothetical protein VFT56_12380 [Sphingomonas sp.]|nr:hypothetical protein [Sphingomonas sp.]